MHSWRRPDRGDALVAELLGRCRFPSGRASVHCAVSGGADSTALLALALAAGLEVTAVHVDHGLRPDSAADAEHVERLATSWGADVVVHRVLVEAGSDLEARARAARRSVLAPDALWGHTADDQAETVLLRLLRGTGPSGLAAMRPATHPLLGLRRRDTHALCEHLGVDALRDPMNDDARFTRNRVRHEVLPLLEDVADRDVVSLLCRLAEQAGEQADGLERLAEVLDPTDVSQLRAADPILRSTALRRWWRDTSGVGLPPDRAALERMLAVVSGDAAGCEVTAGWQLRRSSGRLRLVAPA